ncbi:MAG: hypothetical protein M4D80_11985 [Myxococcota bacterium]|nr:hypothetical protein [Deltaproteobacteria bacterium]MDQ3335879.1 hypothetical protein [Myxococcota bacterium]
MDLFLFRTVAPTVVAITFLMVVLVLAPFFLYLLVRWRASRDSLPLPDTQLGLKFALHYFAMSAFQILLAGGALLIYMLISPGTAEKGTSGYRVALALMIPAGIILAAHLHLLKRTNDDSFPSVRRLFWGYNMIITGIVAFFALVLGFQALFAKGPTLGVGHMAGSMVVVYGAAWAIVGFKFGQLVLGTPPSGGPSQMIDPTLAPPIIPTPPAQSHTGLPSLGGGSFPPIDRT